MTAGTLAAGIILAVLWSAIALAFLAHVEYWHYVHKGIPIGLGSLLLFLTFAISVL